MLYREGSHFYQGVEHQQTEPAFPVMRKILEEHKPDQIIEIGTGMGGCTLFFSEFAPVVTYDIVDRTGGKLKGNQRIHMRLDDCFAPETVNEILYFIEHSGRVFLMCDGEAKAREVRLYAPHLKPGDIVFCHDWDDQFGWDDVKEAVGGDDFEPVEKDLCDEKRTNLQGWKKI
jgi:cephalosporin hydroxylase